MADESGEPGRDLSRGAGGPVAGGTESDVKRLKREIEELKGVRSASCSVTYERTASSMGCTVINYVMRRRSCECNGWSASSRSRRTWPKPQAQRLRLVPSNESRIHLTRHHIALVQ
jgi:hypothetical protein